MTTINANAYSKPLNKTEAVRKILLDLGFMKEDVPSNWKNQVVSALRKQHMFCHDTTIYQIRKKYMRAMENDSRTPIVQTAPVVQPSPESITVQPTIQPQIPQPNIQDQLTFTDIHTIKMLAGKFGSYDKLTEAVSSVKQLFE